MSKYNGWENKETWLVGVWYMDSMPDYFADMDEYYVEPYELRETVEGIALECEAMSRLECGLLSDFISDAFSVVDWDSLAEYLNEELAELNPEEETE